MISLNDLSLRWKIPLRVMGAVLGTALAVTSALVARGYDESQQQLEAHAKSLARVLANTLVTPFTHDDVWRAFEILQSIRDPDVNAPELQTEVVLITDADFNVFVSTQPLLHPIGSTPAEHDGVYAQIRSALLAHPPMQQMAFSPPSAEQFFVISPLISDGAALGHVILAYPKITLLPAFLSQVERAVWVTLLVLAVILPISWIWARSTGAPLLSLATAMRHVPGRLDVAELPQQPRSRDEIGQLGDAFRRMVEELKEKQELENQMLVSERLAAVGRLSASIAHEINNPLGGMLTAIKTYQRHGDNDALAQQTLSLLERGLGQIRNTVAALLVETRTEDRRFEPADLEDILILVEAEANTRSLRISVDNGISKPLPLPATLLRQILLNLLLNAVAAAAEGGEVRLLAKPAESMLRLTVSNDGRHIPEEQMAYLFEPFTSGGARGHGLGLWIVYQIVRQLNGSVSVVSEPGHTAFCVEIPHAAV